MKQLKRILHVEDVPSIQVVTRIALEKLGGFEVLSCPSGQAALEQVRDFAPDLILLDVMLPNMDGIGMIKAFRAWESENGRTRRQHAVCLTGAEERVSEEELLEAGFDEVVRKPITKAKIDALLQRTSHRL